MRMLGNTWDAPEKSLTLWQREFVPLDEHTPCKEEDELSLFSGVDP